VNQYLLSARIGSGSFSHVFLAIADQTGELSAIKRLRVQDTRRESEDLGQAVREIQFLTLFKHPNIVKLREILQDRIRNDIYLVLEYAEHGSLEGFIGRRVRLSESALLSIVKQILKALKCIHGQGYVHEDVKPGNILLFKNGVAKLSDFGTGHSFRSFSMVVGSAAYQPPEVMDEEEDGVHYPEKEDVWALGVTLYQSLFLELPFSGADLYEVVNAIKTSPVAFPDGTDLEIANLVRRMLDPNPETRATVDELLANPLIQKAAETADGIPEVPTPEVKSGQITEIKATVINAALSNFTRGVQKRLRFRSEQKSEVANRRSSTDLPITTNQQRIRNRSFQRRSLVSVRCASPLFH
jgi:serine/threonine protein kinase